MGERGREYVEQRFDRTLVVDAYMEELEIAVSQRKKR